jgi:two-component system capsular synthesis response regulator RcsB
MTTKIRIICADDHPVMRLGVRKYLNDSARFEVIGEAADLPQLDRILDQQPCDVLITDVSMPCGPGDASMLVALKRYRRSCPDMAIVVMTVVENGLLLRGLTRAGVHAIVSKCDVFRELRTALEQVNAGGTYFSTTILELLNRPLRELSRTGALTRREWDIVRLFVAGRSVSEIAAQLGRSRKTVSAQKRNAMKKLGFLTDGQFFCGFIDANVG